MMKFYGSDGEVHVYRSIEARRGALLTRLAKPYRGKCRVFVLPETYWKIHAARKRIADCVELPRVLV